MDKHRSLCFLESQSGSLSLTSGKTKYRMEIFRGLIEEATRKHFSPKVNVPINTEGYKEAHGVALSILSLFLYF